MMGWESGLGWGGAVWMVVFWTSVIALIVWGVSKFSGPPTTRRRAEDILEERFALGEIDANELEKGRHELARR